MKNFLRTTAAAALFLGLMSFSSAARAQAVALQQQGNGALVQKTDRTVCMTADLTGLKQCVNMTQVNYVVTPSGNQTSVWKGTVPAELRPATTLVKEGTWQEGGKTYSARSTTAPSGEISLTLHYKGNGKK
ncbi:hypothetical protein [Hymenobacter cellulosivorans]|uniref:Uncharacterized protein n=1 Tax=Hymenobacter cellulosivorans TaxID=2932249 RepID=A0ABY4FDC1_9BACT|nr:hypothetical protein [Hymenobacter cellulosivorans]UOQ54018.1 hypothetical protein MUN80_04475 [Hymenobacter cellulosivorans]